MTTTGWRVSVLRTMTKTTKRLRLAAAPETTIQGEGAPTTIVPTLADVTMTTVDGLTWQVHGVTVASGSRGAGHYFRRRIADGTWADGTPDWIVSLAEATAGGHLVDPSHLCSRCGYAVEPGDEGWDGPWRHVEGVPALVHHDARPVMSA